MSLPYVFVSGTTILAAQVNANFAAVALTDLSNLSLSKTAGNVIIGTGTGFASNALIAGSGITITPGAGTVTISSTGATALTVGTSTVSSGSNAYILYNNAGVLGNYAISGTGTTVAMATGAALTTPTIQAGGFSVTPQLSAPSYAQGLVWYDSGNDGLSYYNGATGNQVIAGQQVQLRVYNATASIIPIGTPVYITGTFSALPTVSPAVNTSLAASQCIGLTTQAIAVSGTGYVMSVGTLSGLNTGSYTAGNALYVGATAGTLTSTQPTGAAFSSLVGYVAVSNATTGKITVNATPSNGGSSSSGLTVGTTTITSGTSGYVLYDNAGLVGELVTTGSGSVVQATSPTLVTPALGTPSSATLTNATGLPLTTGVSGILPVSNGGTGTSTPALVAGTNVTITGSWPNQTIAASGGGGGSSINVQQAGSTVVTGLTTLNFVQGATVAAASTTANVSIPTKYYGSGAPGVAIPSLDGTPVTAGGGNVSTLNVTFSTTGSNRVAVLVVGNESPGTTTIVPTSVTSPHLTWTKRSSTNSSASRGSHATIEVWWAQVPTLISSETVTATYSTAVDGLSMAVFCVQNVGSISSPWDPNGSIPVASTQTGTGLAPPPAPTFSTTDGYNFVFTTSWSSDAVNDTSAWTTLFQVNNGSSPANWAYLTSFYERVSSAQIGATASLTSSSNAITIRTVDALTGLSGSLPLDGDIYFDISTTPYNQYVYYTGAWHQVGSTGSGAIPTLANTPTASTFTYTLGSPTSKTTQAGVGVLFDSGTFGSSDNITGYGVAVPGSTPYTFTLGMSSPLIQQANMVAGLFLTDGTKIVTIGNAAQSTGGVKIDQWANNTTYAGQPFWETGQMYPFFRVTNNGTNLTYYYSLNGYSWLAFYQEAIAAYLGTITYAGFCINNNYTSGQAPPTGTHGQATVFYWLQS